VRILHLSNVIGEHKGGGVHEVVSNLYKYQKYLQHNPHIWYPGSDEDADSIRLDENIKGLATYCDSKYGLVKNLFSSIQHNIEQFDIIHQHGIWMPMSLYSKRLRQKVKIQGVVQPHGYLEPFQLNISKYKKLLAYNLFEKSNLKSANALVACAYDEAYKLKKLFPKKNIAVVPNGISSDFFNAKYQKDSLKEKQKMLFLSQIIPIKGLERLFRVIASIGINKFINWELTIAGYEDKKHTIFLKNLAKELGLINFVSFVGPKVGEEKVRIFDNADLFILPTYNENYGIVVAEALARKVPVLTTQGTPWSELNTNNCGLWVENNEKGIRNGLLQVLEMTRSDLKNMGIQGRTLVEEKYLWSKITLKTIEFYEWVLNGGAKPDYVI